MTHPANVGTRRPLGATTLRAAMARLAAADDDHAGALLVLLIIRTFALEYGTAMVVELCPQDVGMVLTMEEGQSGLWHAEDLRVSMTSIHHVIAEMPELLHAFERTEHGGVVTLRAKPVHSLAMRATPMALPSLSLLLQAGLLGAPALETEPEADPPAGVAKLDYAATVHSSKTRPVGGALMLTLAVLVTACSSYETVARETFSSDRSCPLAGITAQEHPELSAYDLIFGKATPPADIAGDPARVAIWKEKADKSKESWDNSKRVFVVAGCNEKSYYTCSAGGKSGRRSCSSVSRTKP